VVEHADPAGLLLAIRAMTSEQVSLDDVTAVAVYRLPEDDRR
jgi:phosphoserine phosphatase RsbU/P